MKSMIVIISLYIILSAFYSGFLYPDNSVTIFLFNPEGRQSQGRSAKKALEGYLESKGYSPKIYIFSKTRDIDISIKRLRPSFAIVPSYYYRSMKKKYRWRELLSGYNRNNSGLRKYLVTDKSITRPAMLRNLGIATVSLGPSTNSFVNKHFLLPIGLSNSKVRLVMVSKDIDGIMALGFGQVKGAIVTRNSFKRLKKINPNTTRNLKVLRKLPVIQYPKVVTFPWARNLKKFKNTIQRIQNKGNIRNLFRFLGITRFQ